MSSIYLITPHLKSNEVACPCCGQVQYEQAFVDQLEYVRLGVGLPFIYTSFFRCVFHNDSLVNASKDSFHLLGRAADISCTHWASADKWNFVKYAVLAGLSIMPYPKHFHVDNRGGSPIFKLGSY